MSEFGNEDIALKIGILPDNIITNDCITYINFDGHWENGVEFDPYNNLKDAFMAIHMLTSAYDMSYAIIACGDHIECHLYDSEVYIVAGSGDCQTVCGAICSAIQEMHE